MSVDESPVIPVLVPPRRARETYRDNVDCK